jgi:non-homologous end joining protein Ku
MASPLQLAPASWQSQRKAAHQQTRPSREQPLEAPQLERPTELLNKKQKGLPIAAAKKTTPDDVVNLMDALRASDGSL